MSAGQKLALRGVISLGAAMAVYYKTKRGLWAFGAFLLAGGVASVAIPVSTAELRAELDGTA